ncbi:hypothetical protein [Mycobacterium sp. shizuoka-1]|uniref:hypothetical protein n=1 Tax=Mycobacterium sp. shizuoka-1 TaxID=2039281 RepID=UPI000C0617E7|nr:hypothetical protein [Mycobacterium sp. shizuoka-1]GAY14033.1 hypothetical protein MSZK_07590 [Mycobacterium sp. shizuoka-1]
MWIDLYLVAAVVIAVSAWLVSPRFQSIDPPGDVARMFWSAVAGALWPLVLIGVAQVYAIGHLLRKLRPARSVELDLAAEPALLDVSLRA